jgi:hypothetical protein
MTTPIIILAACLLSAIVGWLHCYFYYISDYTPPDGLGELPPPDEPIGYYIPFHNPESTPESNH